MNSRKVLLLVASPRGAASTSKSLGEHLLAVLEERGMALKTLQLYPALGDERKMSELLGAVDLCDLLVLAFPLYVDQLPAPLIDLLRLVAERRNGQARTGQALAAIVNCGFPETAHCRPAADIVRLFSAQAGFRFLGCLATGMGGAIGNRPLGKAGAIVRHQRRALDRAAAFLCESREIPADVLALMGRAMMPRWFYNFVADRGWKKAAKKYGTANRLFDRHYDGRQET
jgi:hypothetical protein